MMTLGAHEILIIILAWVVISFGPLVAQLTIAMVRRFMGQGENTGSDGLSGGRA